MDELRRSAIEQLVCSVSKRSRSVKRFTLSVLLLLLPLASVDDHAAVEALQETRRLFSLLHLNLQQTEGHETRANKTLFRVINRKLELH